MYSNDGIMRMCVIKLDNTVNKLVIGKKGTSHMLTAISLIRAVTTVIIAVTLETSRFAQAIFTLEPICAVKLGCRQIR